ncbi:MAG: glycosyltransferase family 2 protein, partial [Brevinematales bacterium]
MHKKTAVIVISYNFWHDTVECLESLLRNDYPDYFVIVYDNGSTDGAPDHIRAWAEGKETPERTGGALERLVFPFLKKPLPYAVLDNSGKVLRQSGKNPILYLVEGGSNLGFPGGNNVAIRIALDMKAEIITLLNNDTVVEPGFLTPLADFLGHDDKTGSAGAAGGTICYYSRPEKRWAAGGGKLHWLTAGSAHYGMDFSPSNLPAGPVRLGYITGCLIALTAEAINRAGLMDDKYFLYYDETDWAVRLRD